MAIKEQDKVFYEEAENGDKIINLPVTRVNNVEGIGRIANTAYSVGNVVYTDSNLSVALKCITAGTTSDSELDISGNAIGDTVTDGSVTWQVCNRTSAVDSVNGQTGDVVTDTFPVGAILPFSGDTVPVGYLTCNGAAVSRTLYADLFAVIGTTYGAGDGSTTFNLPNLNNGSFLEGSNTAGTVKEAGLPNITGHDTLGWAQLTDGVLTNGGERVGAFANGGKKIYGAKTLTSSTTTINETLSYGVGFDASLSNSIYGNSETVQPKSVTIKFIIKAFASITNGGNVDAENIMSAVEGLQSSVTNIQQSVTGISDYIVESYNNGTDWYRVWKSGWLEQGGVGIWGTVTLFRPYRDTNYVLLHAKTNASNQTGFGSDLFSAWDKTTTSFTTINSNTIPKDWYTCGWSE